MTIPGVVILFLSAIVIAVALNHLYLAFRIKSPILHTAIFLTGLTGFFYFLLVYFTYQVGLKTDLLIRMYRMHLVLMQISLVTLLWSFSLLYDLAYRKWLNGLLASFIALLMLTLLLPSNILFGTDAEATYNMVFGSQVTMLRSGPFLYRMLGDLSVGITAFFAIIMVARNPMKGKVKSYASLIISMGLLITTGTLDHLTDSGNINLMYLLPLGYFLSFSLLSTSSLKNMVDELRLNAELALEEKKWRMMVEEIQLIIVELNTLGQIKYANPYLLKLTEYSEQEILGKDWFEIILPSEYSYEVQGAFIELLAHDFNPRYQNPILTKSGKERTISWYNVRLSDNKGKITGSISVGVDITELVDDKEQLEKMLGEAKSLIDKLQKK